MANKKRTDTQIDKFKKACDRFRLSTCVRTPKIISNLRQYGYAFLVVALITVFNYFLRDVISYQTNGFVFLFGIILVSFSPGWGPLFFTAVVLTLIWDYAFIPPIGSLWSIRAEDNVMCLVFFSVALLSGTLTNRLRKKELALQSKERQTRYLYELADTIARGGRVEFYLEQLLLRSEERLPGEVALFLIDANGQLKNPIAQTKPFTWMDKEQEVAERALQLKKSIGWGTDTLSSSTIQCSPLIGLKFAVGIIAFRPRAVRYLNPDQEILFRTLVQLLASSVEREKLEGIAADADRLRESERLFQTLLNSISHELRTPVTTLMGTASVLLQMGDQITSEVRTDLLTDLRDAGERLNQVVDNLLDVSRFETGHLALKMGWVDMRELVYLTLKRLKIDGPRVAVYAEEGLPFVRGDAQLLEHVLFNLVANALKYSPRDSAIEISLMKEVDSFVLSVSDRGPGVRIEELDKIFDKFYRAPGSAGVGVGLGLAVVRGIMEAHQGLVVAKNGADGGMKFTLKFKLQDSMLEGLADEK